MDRRLSDWVESYLVYTDDTEPRKSFREWCAISVIAAVLQRRCWLDIGFEIFYPNMYIVLVGPPASRKGTAMKPGRVMLEELGIPLAADESTRQKLITRMINGTAMSSDGSSIGFHSSITIYSSELTVFLGYNNIELLTMLCKWYDCESTFRYDTISRGEEEILNVWANLIGATTPMLIQSSLPQASIGSGFTSRTVFVYEDDKAKIVVFPQEDKELQKVLTLDLEHIKTLKGAFRMAEDFRQLYDDWRNAWEKDPPFKNQALDFYLQRRHVHLLKMCMIYSASRSDEMVLRGYDFARSLTMLENTESNMPHVFEGVGSNPLAEVQARIIREISIREEIYLSELMDLFYNDVTQRQLAEIIAMLQERRFCKLDINTRLVTCLRRPEHGSKTSTTEPD